MKIRKNKKLKKKTHRTT